MAKNPKLPSKPTSTSPNRISLFGPPPILEGEDSAAYDALLARISGDVKPADIFEEIWVRDIVDLTWEIFRWRRLKIGLLATATPNALERTLASIVRKRPSNTKELGGFPNLNLSLTPRPPSAEQKLVKKWAARDPTAIKRVNKLMASANVTMDTVLAKAFVKEFDHIERIDRLVTIAEGRRNAVLREIDRHRTTLAQVLRERMQEAEEAEFEIIEPNIITSKNDTDKNVA